MIKKILLAVTLLFTANTMAASCSDQINDISGLTNTARQNMIIACEQAKLPQNTNRIVQEQEDPVETMDRWSEISLKFAKALGVAAKELGVAVNEFIDTPAGKLTAVFIGWKIVGDSATLVIVGFLGLFILHKLANTLRNRMTLLETKIIEGKFRNREEKVYEKWSSMYDGTQFLVFASYVLEFIYLIVLVLNIV